MVEEDLEDVRYWITEEGIKALDNVSSDEIFRRNFLMSKAEPCKPGECHCEDGWLP